MDLVGSESRKTGTRGGRADFTWDAVKDDERQYYLGNSVAKPLSSRRHHNPTFDWYTTPILPIASDLTPLSSSQPSSVPAQSVRQQSHPADSVSPNPSSAPNHRSIPSPPSALPTTVAPASKELHAVRRREKTIMDRMLVGRSFSDSVRDALTVSVDSGVDDEGPQHGNSTFAAAAAAERRAVRGREKTEKAQRKEARRRIRELRRSRRAEKNRRRDRHHQAQAPSHDSSESERESLRSRMQEDAGRRRRRRERDVGTSRKRPQWSSTSDSDDPDQHRTRRQRLR